MTVNTTRSLGTNSSSETRSVFICSQSPKFIWDLNHTTSLKVSLSVTTIACPATILLNLLVIIAVKTRRELKKNCNILLSRLAITDLLVGAVSMPLTITLDALVLQRILIEDVICTIDVISDSVLYILCLVSLFHLVLIAWERYVAVVKWMRYKAIVTKHRVKKYSKVTWFLALLVIVPLAVMVRAGVRSEPKIALEVTAGILWVLCLWLLIYFYVKVYLGVRNQNRLIQIRSVNAPDRIRVERKIASTTLWVTVSVCISGIPTLAVFLGGRIWPFLRESPSFRAAETMFQFNSLVNPLLYFYRNRQLRKAVLELLRRGRKPQEIMMQAVARNVRRPRRRRYSEASQNVEELQIVQEQLQERPRLTRSECCDAVACPDTVPQGSNEAIEEIPMSAPLPEDDQVFTQQPNKVVVTAQIETAPREKRGHRNTLFKPAETMEVKRFRHRMVAGKIARSTSLNEKSLITLTNCHQNSAERNFRKRSRSLPVLLLESTNFSALCNKLSVSELTSEKELTCEEQ